MLNPQCLLCLVSYLCYVLLVFCVLWSFVQVRAPTRGVTQMQFGEKVHVSHQQCEHFGLHCVQCVQYVSAIIIIHCSYAQLEWPFCHIKMCSAHSQWSCLHGKEEDPTDCELCHTDQQIYTQRRRLLFFANLCLSSESTGTFLMVCNLLKKEPKADWTWR